MRNNLGWIGIAALLASCGGQNGLEITEDVDVDPGNVVVNPSAEDAQALSSMPACGTVLQVWNGTAAYSNGGNTGTGVSCGGTGSYGYQYQCVELVMRHFKKTWGLRWYGNAKDLLNNAPSSTVSVYWNGDAAHPPVPGDMLVWRQGTYGHVALITRVTSSSVEFIEQNVTGSGRATLGYANGTIATRWGSWVPAGWAHAKANTQTPPVVDAGTPVVDAGTPVNWSCGSSSYGGKQYWTCSGGSAYRCENGTPVQKVCSAGCMVRPLGTDDLCIEPTSNWSCGSSSYAGKQYWTCSGGSIYKCDNGQPRKVTCPSGCNVRALGTDDDCK